MIIHTTTDQSLCAEILEAANLTGKISPIDPANSTIGFTKVNAGTYLIVENDQGNFTCHCIEEATEREAWAYFDKLNFGAKTKNMRAVFSNPMAQSAANN